MIDQQRIHVLVADHDRWTRVTVADMLAEAGFAVEQVSNGLTALRVAAADPPHIVLIGPDLPEVGTAEVVRLLRRDPRMRHMAVVESRAVGQHSPTENPNPDVDGHLDLPCNPIELFATVLNALEARNATPLLSQKKSEGRGHERPQTGTRQAVPDHVSPQRSHLYLL